MLFKVVISRRRFLSISAIGTIGSLTQDIPFGSPSASPSPAPEVSPDTVATPSPTSPSPTPTPTPEPVPDRPDRPSLLGDDLQGRGPDFLKLKWNSVAASETYELRISSSLGNSTLVQTVPEATINGLTANLTYEIAVRALNSSGASPWSELLVTCTRPPVPTAPQLALGQMIEIPSEVSLTWDLKNVVAGANEGISLKVELGVRNASGDIAPIRTNLELVDRAVLPNQQIGESFFLRLSGLNPAAPAGNNVSAWSTPTVLAPMVFGELRVPSVSESLTLSVSLLRGYYGNS